MSNYNLAKQIFADIGIDTEAALNKLDKIPISMHCWQGDDCRGFETFSDQNGGIQASGNHPGRAKNPDELRANMDRAFALIPGTMKVNIHAMYGEFSSTTNRDTIEPKHFQGWVDWAKEKKRGLDFNPTMFNHPKSAQGLTLSHPDHDVRAFWVSHVKRCREIAVYFGEQLEQVSLCNLWVPDGYKDIPADQLTPRRHLEDSLDEIYREYHNPSHILDVVESKLFGLGLESYTVGSHEFYFGYAIKNGIGLCLDTGHFHPTELVSSKISAVALFIPQILLHVSRPVRWDSDHIVLLDDETINIAKEVIRHDLLGRVHIGLDYFDGSVDRISAWAIGARNMRKALLIALLEPYSMLRKAEDEFDFTRRIALHEEAKMLPWTAVWDEYCERKNVPKRLAL